jgi:hypothetical protein
MEQIAASDDCARAAYGTINMEESVMFVKTLVAVCLVGSMIAPSVAWSAGMSRGACINAVQQKLGSRATDAGENTNKAAVHRCMRHGLGAI